MGTGARSSPFTRSNGAKIPTLFDARVRSRIVYPAWMAGADDLLARRLEMNELIAAGALLRRPGGGQRSWNMPERCNVD